MKTFNEWLRESAARWGVAKRTARWVFWAPLIATLAILALQVSRDLFRFLLEEDGPVEWLSAIFFVGIAVIAVRIGFNRFKTGHSWQAVLFVSVALVMFFAGGEEVSWGQRVFGWDTPEELIGINDQEETNLHNIGIMLQLTNIAMFLTGAYGTVAYIANRSVRLGQYWDQADYLFVPPFFLASYFFPILMFRLARITIFTESNFTLNRIGEWAEMVVALGLLIFFWLALVHISSPASDKPVAEGLA